MKPISNIPGVEDNAVKLISLENLVPFSKHKFTLYQGERLDDMVASIKKSGVIVPIIVRTVEDSGKFEILSGHNRVYASGLAGLVKVPAVIKTNISDETAMIYAIETNVIQRGFKDLKISEQAFAVAMRYKKLFDEKKLAAIDEELHTLLNSDNSRVPVGHGERIRDETADMYGIGSTTVARLLRINELTDNVKRFVDSGDIKIRTAVELSYLSPEQQKNLYDAMSENGINSIDMKTAKRIREFCSENEASKEDFISLLSEDETEKISGIKPYRLSLDHSVFDRYFKDVPKKDVGSIVEKALEMYFSGKTA